MLVDQSAFDIQVVSMDMIQRIIPDIDNAWSPNVRSNEKRIRPNITKKLFRLSCSSRFEQAMSVELFDAGATVAYLPDVTFEHVGADKSAYVANGMPRPWDRPQSVA